MGRSQVEYNRTHGRPGSKGRGGRGRGRLADDSASSRTNEKNLGDNAWRYEDKEEQRSENSDDVVLLQQHALLAMSGSHYQVSQQPEEDTDTAIANNQEWDLVAMSKALRSVPVHERLRVPAYLTESLGGADHRELQPPGDSKPKDTGFIMSRDQGTNNETRTNLEPLKGEKERTTKDNLSDADANEDDDDMEAWLDSVIS